MVDFRVELANYQGPLDLLVQLARSEELDILEITVSEVSRRYVEFLATRESMDLDEVGEFLVLASTLMEMKSRALVPGGTETPQEAEEETKQELVRQLLEYKRFKEAAALLWEKAQLRNRKLRRLADDLPPDSVDPATQPIRELELWDLVSAFSRLMKENVIPVAENILRDPTPITTYMERFEARVLERGKITFRELLGLNNTRSQLIGKFLALLELIKCKKVWVELDENSFEIVVLPPRPQAVLPMDPSESFPMPDANVPPEFLEPPPASPWGEQETGDVDPPREPPKRRSAWDDFEPLDGPGVEPASPSDPPTD
ncbi:MAG: segregation/condensation protein A [Planctomycetota bacterium]